ncbi:MAG: CDP-alcohol phosphatidyltransferase family protein [Candidatus Heimdallarchaeota archaeon]
MGLKWPEIPHWLIVLAFFTTLANIACGILGMIAALDGNIPDAFKFLLLGAVLDFLDGRIAKMAPTESDIGVYADSVADVITFAALPGFMILNMDDIPDLGLLLSLELLLALLYTLCGWYRLVQFATKPTGVYFLGLPAPAAAMMVGSALVVALDDNFDWLMPPELVVLACIACSMLMITKIRYPSPKRGMRWDLILIFVAQLSGAWYIAFETSLAILSVFICSLLYVVLGPLYLLAYDSDITPKT